MASPFALELFILIISVITFLIYHQCFKPKKYPPGPKGIPIIGHLPFFTTKNLHVEFTNLGKTYGSVMSVPVAMSRIVCINGWRAVEEGYKKDGLLGRPGFLKPIMGLSTLIDASGDLWKEQRDFAHQVLKSHGLGKSRMVEQIQDEITHLLTTIADYSKKSTAVVFNDHLAPSVANNICILLFGRRYEYDDPKRAKLDKPLNVVPKLLQSAQGIQTIWPWLAYCMVKFNLGHFGIIKKLLGDINYFVRNEIDIHKKKLDADNPEDFIDSYLVYQKELGPGKLGNFTDERLVLTAQGFFGGGSETVRTTSIWAMMLMSEYKDVQERVHKELDEVVGKERQVAWTDRINLPYTKAVIYELERWASVTPLGIPREALEDCVVDGHSIPKGTTVLFNLWSVHHDPAVYPEPEKFNPDRFYDQSTNTVTKPVEFAPLGLGKRNCIGKSLADVEVFLFFASILQRFTISSVDGKKFNWDKNLGTSLSPIDQPIFQFTDRIKG